MPDTPKILKSLDPQNTLIEILEYLRELSKSVNEMDKELLKTNLTLEQQSKDLKLLKDELIEIKQGVAHRITHLEMMLNDAEKGLLIKVARHDAILSIIEAEAIPETIREHTRSINLVKKIL